MVTDSVTLHLADTVLPVDARPIVDGGIAVRAGRIVGVGSTAALRSDFPDADARRWRGVMTPGLVNAHTHLQYTSFAPVGGTRHENYTAWSVAFVEEYDARRNDDWLASANAGVDQMLTAGITCIADIVTDYVARNVLHDRAVPGVAYLELIGTDDASWQRSEAARLRQAIAEAPTTDVTSIGISPHAPYSLDEPVLEGMAALARELGVRLHVHVAESDGEDEYYRSGTGSLADRLRIVSNRPLGILERGGAGMTAAELVEHLGLTGPDSHIAHGVYLGRDGRAIMARTGTIVALCPRSNLVVGIDPPPVADFLREAVPFAVGTDSLGSSPSLDLMEDVALLRSLAVEAGYDDDDVDCRLVEAATITGAMALGLADHLGSLTVGKRADVAIFDVDASLHQVEHALVEHGAGSCVATIVSGEVVSEAGRTDSGS